MDAWGVVLGIAQLNLRARMMVIAGLLLYFIPWVIAIVRNHPKRSAIALLTLLLGWTVIGWITALLWSIAPIQQEKRGNIN